MYEGSSIKAEHEYYDAHKAEFVEKYLGKRVLIYKQKFWGVFDTGWDALDFAHKNNFEKDRFMIKRVVDKEPTVRVCGLWSK